jgi:hypothetical protein
LISTKATTTRYLKGAILSTKSVEYENFYEGKLLTKTIQRINGLINTITIYTFHPNGRVKRKDK